MENSGKVIGRAAALAVWAAVAGAAAGLDPAAVLERVTAKMKADGKRIPNYACVETITREFYLPIAPTPMSCEVALARRKNPTLNLQLRHAATDRLRLDVAMSDRGELHSWVGASRFEEGGIESVVQDGPVSTGTFGSFLVVIFTQDVKHFHFEREVEEGGRRLLEYSFAVPDAESHYKFKVENQWVYLGYSGRFGVDPATADVTRLDVTSSVLPDAAGTCQTSTRLDLARVPIAGNLLLLPTLARQTYVAHDAGETVNTMEFSSCREYRGESVITFGAEMPDARPGPSKRAAPRPPPSVRAGQEFGLQLTDAIPTDTAAAGDPFHARLTAALRDMSGKIVAPKGARVEGRLLRVMAVHGPRREGIVVFRPESVEAGGVTLRLAAVPDFKRTLAAKGRARAEIMLPAQWETNAGVFRFAGEHAVAPRGFSSLWRTVEVK